MYHGIHSEVVIQASLLPPSEIEQRGVPWGSTCTWCKGWALAKQYGAQEYYESWHGQKVLSLQRGGPYRQELSQESITTAAAALLQLWKGRTHQEGLPLANATQAQRCTG